VSPVVILVLAWAGLVLAAIPALLTLANLRLFRPPPEPAAGRPWPQVSVLVPARNEAGVIERLVRDVLASRGVDLELVILDDDSTDGTAAIVERLAAHDARVQLVRGGPLPAGWCGKQHACWQLARAATRDTWLFLDVDVVPHPDAIHRSVAFLEASGASLVSGFPRQVTGSFLEWLLLPLIHFVLLGFLPLARSRQDRSPGLAAGCGQWFVTRRADYERAGGHAAIKASLHDGIMLPRAYRRAAEASEDEAVAQQATELAFEYSQYRETLLAADSLADGGDGTGGWASS
jgi:glycosyltransferase involved in cell wall biosynthesis